MIDGLRELQQAELGILKEFIRICEENGLRYFAIGGTALGAARHGGFIPWDDDIDVSMPRADYLKFAKIAPKVVRRPYEFRSMDTTEFYTVPLLRLVDPRVEMAYQNPTRRELVHDALLDIFPTDGLPDSRFLRWLHVRTFLLNKRIFNLSLFEWTVNQERQRPPVERAIMWLGRRVDFSRFIRAGGRARAGDRILTRYGFGETRFCTPQLWGQYRFRAIFPTAWFADTVLLPFEDLMVRVPVGYEEYLSSLYGADYMKIPPEGARVMHASRVIVHESVCEPAAELSASTSTDPLEGEADSCE